MSRLLGHRQLVEADRRAEPAPHANNGRQRLDRDQLGHPLLSHRDAATALKVLAFYEANQPESRSAKRRTKSPSGRRTGQGGGEESQSRKRQSLAGEVVVQTGAPGIQKGAESS